MDRAALNALAGLPQVAPVVEKWRSLTRDGDAGALALTRSVADRLYPRQFATSVSALEQYAACPFKFFVARGLRAGERIEFEPDTRQRGSFQHRVLQVFQERLAREGRRWRDVPPAEAAALIDSIGEAQLRAPEHGVFQRDASARFAAGTLIRNLQKLAATLVTWARHYAFEPAASELTFDSKSNDAWRIALDGGRELLLNGRMDRVDLCPDAGGRVLATVIDYKSSARKLDNVKLAAGLDLQLLSYLGVLRRVRALAGKLGGEEILPMGAFYVSLAPKRAPAQGRGHAKPANPFQHVGRFQCEHLALFDNRAEAKGVQFRIALKQDGGLAKNGNDGLPEAEFQALLELVENHLRRFATELLDGRIAVDPFFHAGITACERCDYAAVCRFDAWTQRYRVLSRSTARPVSGKAAENGGAE
jgi:ATP-dependent helicase/nuclease subunit B